MPGFELIGIEEKEAVNQVFDDSLVLTEANHLYLMTTITSTKGY